MELVSKAEATLGKQKVKKALFALMMLTTLIVNSGYLRSRDSGKV
ncbi:MAG: hypothetical protein ACI9EW_003959 [Cellvibrionaceae bacterium]|jgi:hypothetical protein